MNRHPCMRVAAHLAACAVLLAVPGLLAQSAPAEPKQKAATGTATPKVPAASHPARPDSTEAEEDIVQLSPFQVVGDTRGYYSANTMSGTRLNTKIEDLGSSISVVTKEQMEDFGMLDVNDIFSYAANTEGTGNYTSFDVDRRGNVIDNIVDDPQGANRIRGLGPANNALGNFATSGRMPMDPTMLDSVEISRGPNSNIFGLGNASGTVNVVPATANLSRDFAKTQVRADSYDGYRGSLEVNRVLVPNHVAIRGSAALQHNGFQRKPSGIDTQRFNAMVKWQPFKYTTIRGAYYSYHSEGNRANTITPRDTVSFWKASGSPTWDPVTYTVHINGAAVGTYPSATGLPSYFRTNNFMNRSTMFIDQAGLGWWGVQQTPSSSNPSSPNQAVRMIETSYDNSIKAKQPLFATWPALTDRGIYDWKSLNLSSINWVDDNDRIGTAEIEQIFLNTDRQLIAAQVGWMHESAKRYNRNLMGKAAGAGIGSLFEIDVNERLIDGEPNPYFLRPYLGIAEPVSTRDYLGTDILRAQLVYKLDFSRDHGWKSWLGEHRIVGYTEYKDSKYRKFQYRDVMRDPHGFIPAGNPVGDQASPAGVPVARGMFRYYVGDANGGNIDYAPTAFSPGTYAFHWYDGVAKQWVTENAQLGEVATLDNSGGVQNQWNELKTAGVVLQSHFLRNRVVATLGARQDKNFTQFGGAKALSADGLDFDYGQMKSWTGTWNMRSGYTKSAGVVVRPLRWLSLYFNKSDSFVPTTPSQNLLRQELPNPSGDGKDYGFSLNLFKGKLVIRANQYETEQKNSPFGQSGTFAQRILSVDFVEFNNGSGPRLDAAIRNWTALDAANHGITLTPDQIQAEVYKQMQITPETFAALNRLPITDVSDILGRGNEVEINYNPSSYWTMSVNIAKQIAINKNLSTALLKWANQRLSVWQNIRNPVTGELWWNTKYSTANTPASFYQASVLTPIHLDQATDGLARPQVRKYRVNMSTKFRLAGLTDQRILKGISVGGALRWEDKGAIGYYGLQQLPDVITDLDRSRPIWDKSHYYVDLFLGYQTRMFSDRVTGRFQLLVRNLGENGRLQPVGAFPDGTPHSFRIVDPQQFVLTASFDL